MSSRKWYNGNRFIFYLRRSDGVQYWRCCRRIEDKCDAGILCFPSGTILPSNMLPHSHPPLDPASATIVYERIPSKRPLELPEVRAKPDTAVAAIKQPPNKRTDFPPVVDRKPVLKVQTDNNLPTTSSTATNPLNEPLPSVAHGGNYVLHFRRPDGSRTYACRQELCTFRLIMTKEGKMMPCDDSPHSCGLQWNTESYRTTSTSSTTTTTSITGSSYMTLSEGRSMGDRTDGPEIEDPDDLFVRNEDHQSVANAAKRIRIDPEEQEPTETGPAAGTTDIDTMEWEHEFLDQEQEEYGEGGSHSNDSHDQQQEEEEREHAVEELEEEVLADETGGVAHVLYERDIVYSEDSSHENDAAALQQTLTTMSTDDDVE